MGMSNFMAHLQRLQQQVETMPRVARAKLEQLVAQGVRAQMDPYGEKWAPVAGREAKAPVEGAKLDKKGKWRLKGRYVQGGWAAGAFDPEQHIQYIAVIEGKEVKLQAAHKAAKFTRFGTVRMPARAKVPSGDGLGWWEPKLLGALRGHMRHKGIKP